MSKKILLLITSVLLLSVIMAGIVSAQSGSGSLSSVRPDPASDPEGWLEYYRSQLGEDPRSYPDVNALLNSAEVRYSKYSDEERQAAERFLQTADEKTFLRKGFTWDFSESQGYVNEFLDPDIIHQYYVLSGKGTDILMSMLPAAAGVRIGNKRLDLQKGWASEFHVSYTVQRTEDIPKGSGGRCWIQYDDSVVKSTDGQSGIILFPGERAYYFRTVYGRPTYTAIADLSSLNPDELLKFDFIRMNGKVSVYANGAFLFSFEDGIPGNVSFESGSELFKGGNRVRCDFDDFVMTYR